MKVVLPVALTWLAFAGYLLPGGVDQELASGSVAAESGTPGAGLLARSAADADTFQGRTARWWARRAVQARKDANARARTIRRLRRELYSREIGPTLAIRVVFGPYAAAALRVSWCESRWDVNARNGQYLGLLQMGSYARGRYGHGPTALEQARAAYAYFIASGRDWSPWSCKP